MSFDPIAGHLAVELARRTAGSARPDAPVIPDPEPRPPRARAVRERLAAELRTLARRVEPRPRATRQLG